MDMVVAAAPSVLSPDDERTALSKDALKRAFLDNLFYMQGKFPALATKRDYYLALAYVVRDQTNSNLIDNIKKMGQPTEIDKKPAIALPLRVADGVIYLGIIPVGVVPALF